MRVTTLLLALTAVLLFSVSAFAQEKQDGLAVDYARHPYEMADAIVVINPSADYNLTIPASRGVEIQGEIVRVEKIEKLNGPIIHRPGVMIGPLHKNKNAKLFLKKYSDAEAYYLIGNFGENFPSRVEK